GQFGKLDYRVSINSPSRSALNGGASYSDRSQISYNGVLQADAHNEATGNGIYQGYFRYNLWDSESSKLPYNVGTYLGKKKVLALGAGFYLHPNGAYDNTEGQEQHVNVGHFAADAYMDMPTKGGCLNAYASLMSFNFGENYVGRWAGTGTALYGQVGYFVRQLKVMPYLAYQVGNYEGFTENMTSVNAGINYYINGHNAKLTLEYHRINNDLTTSRGDVSQLRLQAHLFL
ncbi:MAG: hypothetical protein AAFZ52_01900, partial [Bacteroidota bacterium]